MAEYDGTIIFGARVKTDEAIKDTDEFKKKVEEKEITVKVNTLEVGSEEYEKNLQALKDALAESSFDQAKFDLEIEERKRKYAAHLAELKKQADTAKAEIEADEAVMPITGDTTGVTENADDAVKEISGKEASLPITGDTTDVTKEAGEAKDEVEGTKADIKVGADTSPAETKADEFAGKELDGPKAKMSLDTDTADAKAETWKEKLKGSLGTTVGTWAGHTLSSIGLAAANFVKNQFIQAFNAGDEIAEKSALSGMSTNAYQEWTYVLKRTNVGDIDISELTNALNSKVDEALNGDEKLGEMFARLGNGFSLEQFAGKDMGERFAMVIEGLRGIANEWDRAAVAADLFGKQASTMNELLGLSAEETAALKAEAHDVGAVMSEESISSSVEWNAAKTRMSETLTNLRNIVVTPMIDLVTAITNSLSDVVQRITSGAKEIKLIEEVEAAKTKVDEFAAKLDGVREKYAQENLKITVKFVDAGGLLDELAALQGKDGLTDDDSTRMKEIAASLTDLYPTLAQYIGENGLISKEAAEIGKLIDQYAVLDKQLALSAAIQSTQEIVNSVGLKREGLQALYDVRHAEWQAALAEQAKASDMTIALYDAAFNPTMDGSLVTQEAAESAKKLLEQFIMAYRQTFNDIDWSAQGINALDVASLFELSAADIYGDEEMNALLVRVLRTLSDEAAKIEDAYGESAAQLNTNAAAALGALNAFITANEGALLDLEAYQLAALNLAGWTTADIAKAKADGRTVQALWEELRAGLEPAQEVEAALEGAAEGAEEGAAAAQEAANGATEAAAAAAEAVADAAAQSAEVQQAVATVEELAGKITAAVEAGTSAQAALTAARESVGTDADAILARMQQYVTDLGTYVAASKDEMLATLANAEGEAATAGEALARGAGTGYRQTPHLRNAATDGVRSTLAAVRSFLNAFYTLGYQLGSGIAQGMRAAADQMNSASVGLIYGALGAGKSAADINSPSGLFKRELGVYMARGTGVGFVEEMPRVLNDIRGSVRLMPSAIRPTANELDYGALGSALEGGTAGLPGALRAALSGMGVYIDGKSAGQILTEPVSRNIANAARAGRFDG